MSSQKSFSHSFSPSFKPKRQPAVVSEELQRTLDKDRFKTLFQQTQKHIAASVASSRNTSPLTPLWNLLDVRGTRVFFWDQERNAIILTDVQDAELDRITILECEISPLFEVTSISVSPEGSSVALIGPKGVSILDLGPEDSLPESGRKIARCIAISERFFLNNPKITILQCEWFPGRETHVVLLTSDSFLRFFRISSPAQGSLVVNLQNSAKRSLHNFASFTLAQMLGGGAGVVTVYALKSDGNVWMFDVTVDSSRTIASSLRGPLLGHAPFANDMSEMATSVMFVEGTLSVLLIASNRNRILHGVLIEKDDIEVDSENHSSSVIPSKYEFIEIERLELNSASPEGASISTGSKTIGLTRLLSCSGFPSCYVLATDRQLLGVTLPWLDDLNLLVSDSLDVSSLRPSSVRTVLSLDPFADAGAVGLIGSRLIPTDLGDCSVLSVASNGQVTLQKLIQSSAVQKGKSDDVSLSGLSSLSPLKLGENRRQKASNEVPFDEYIESILRRDRSLPSITFSSADQFSAEELTRIATQCVQFFQEQHLLKQRQAYEEIQNRKGRNALRKTELIELVQEMESRLTNLDSQFHHYTAQSDNTDLEAMDTHDRISSLQEEFSQFNPVLSDAEKQLKIDLEKAEFRFEFLENLIETIFTKLNFRERILFSNKKEGVPLPDESRLTDTTQTQLLSEINRLDILAKRVKDLTDKLQPL